MRRRPGLLWILGVPPGLVLLFAAVLGHRTPVPLSADAPPFPAPDEPTACAACHTVTDGAVADPAHPLNQRIGLDRAAWAEAIQLEAKCGGCHTLPAPGDLPTSRWGDAVLHFMSKVAYYHRQAPTFDPLPTHQPYRQWMDLTRDQWLDVAHYYFAFSGPDEPLPPDPPPSGLRFEARPIGHPPDPSTLPQIGNVNLVDLDQDGQTDVLVGDFARHRLSWLRRTDAGWTEMTLMAVPYPGHTEVGDFNGDGRPDVVIADVGSDTPTDDRVGRVLLLTHTGEGRFDAWALLKDVGRVADVRPGDVDGDGDVDFFVAVFGFLKTGRIGWLEQQAPGTYAFHTISHKPGAVHVLPTDLNGDGRLDVIALIAQQFEEVAAFINRGDGRFTEHTLFKAASPTFGSSSLEPVDLDRDGDLDLLYTNGDAFDLSSPMIRPYHGVQWLENEGHLRFTYHDLIRFYGAYRAVPADLDGDGDLDIVAASLLNDWSDPNRRSLIWLENDGAQQFTPHGIGSTPTSIITLAVADLTGDGRPDLLTGSMHLDPADPADRRGRVTLWENRGPW